MLDRIATKDRLGNYTYSLPNRVRQVDTWIEPPKAPMADGITTVVDYCGCGAPSAITRGDNTALAETTSMTYDYQGRLKVLTLPDGTGRTNHYDSIGRLLVVTDAYESRTNRYDNLNRLVATVNGAGLVSGASYTTRDWILSYTNANGVRWTNQFDVLGRPRARGYADGGIEYWGYTAGQMEATAHTNQVGDLKFWSFGASRRLTAESVPGVYTNSYTYNGADDLTELVDGKGQTTKWTYDVYGRVREKRDTTNTKILDYLYNANGWLTNRWSLQKGNTKYLYDLVGNLTKVDYPTSADLLFDYDALNRATNDVRVGIITNRYTYHPGGQLESERTLNWASSTVTSGYTSQLRTSLDLEQHNLSDWTHTYSYDNARRLTSVAGSSGTFNYAYTSAAGSTASRLIHRITLPTTSAGPSITNTYDTVGRLLTTHMRNGGTIFNKHDYVVDSAHRRTKQTRTDNSYVNYTYDPASQLRTAEGFTSGGSPITTEQLRYGYDEAQNMLKRTNHTSVATYTVNSRNQVTGGDGSTYTYDNNGNRTYRTTGSGFVEYRYDDENQLVSARTDVSATPEGNRWRTDWAYDARGRLRIKSEYTWLSGSWYPNGTIRYVYDGMRVIQQRSSANASQVTYTRGPDMSGSWEGAGGIGGLLARTAHSGAWGVTYTHAFYHADGNGNITYLLQMNQTLGAVYRYDAYGRTLTSSGTLAGANVYRFSSKELMVQGGLYYYGYRFYDPFTQRWMNRDPIEELGGINLYRAMANSPVDFVDTDGRFVMAPFVIGFGIGAFTSFGGQFISNGGWGDLWNGDFRDAWDKARNCTDWVDVGLSGASGALFGGAVGNLGRAAKGLLDVNKMRQIDPVYVSQYIKPRIINNELREVGKATINGGAGYLFGLAKSEAGFPRKPCN